MNQLGIAIPCFNEKNGLQELVSKLCDPKLDWVDFVIVDNGSSDGSWKYLSLLNLGSNIRIVRIEANTGYGNGILEGIRHLRNEYVGWTHADLQCDPLDLLKFQQHIAKQIDFMKGKRTGRPVIDRFFTSGMSILISLIFQKALRDINAQPTIIRRSVFEKMTNLPKDFALDLSVYIKAMSLGSSIKREPVEFGPRKWGTSHWNTGILARWKFIKRTIGFAWRIRVIEK